MNLQAQIRAKLWASHKLWALLLGRLTYVVWVTVLEVIQRSTEFLGKKGVESSRLQVELLLAHVLQVPRLKLYLNFERTLTTAELETLRDLIKRRGEREPLQHILGSTSFCGHEINVNRDVLVPRPETELLAERAWTFLSTLNSECLTILDLGTGSGCLAVTLAIRCPKATVHAVDISEAALCIARHNASRHQVADRVRFYLGNAFAALPADLRFDLIVTNPPYVPTAEIATLQPEVRDFDPRVALDGGEDGLQYYRLFAEQAATRLKPAARLLMEFGDGQEQALSEIFAAPAWRVEAAERDYSGHPRILVVRSCV
jgi:release factor glutamine methyltransferase